MTSIKTSLLSVILLASSSAFAVDQIEVQALMPGMVVLSIDGQQATLKTGQVSPQGVKMISADSRTAVLEVNGVEKPFQMGTTVSTTFSQRATVSEQVIVDDYGMFRGHGTINGQSVQYLIDTGATSVAMSARHARQLGIQYRLDGKPIRTRTASGIADAWALKLKSVTFGKLVEKNVPGVVIDGDYPHTILLGMTFLNRMKVEKEGSKMIITQKK